MGDSAHDDRSEELLVEGWIITAKSWVGREKNCMKHPRDWARYCEEKLILHKQPPTHYFTVKSAK